MLMGVSDMPGGNEGRDGWSHQPGYLLSEIRRVTIGLSETREEFKGDIAEVKATLAKLDSKLDVEKLARLKQSARAGWIGALTTLSPPVAALVYWLLTKG